MKEHGFASLLIAMIIFLFGLPVAEEFDFAGSPAFRIAIFSCLLIIGVWSLKGAGRLFAFGMSFAVTGVLLNFLNSADHSGFFFVASFLALLGFLVTAIVHTLNVL